MPKRIIMRRFFTLVKLMTVMTFRNRVILFFALIMPTMMLVLFGLIFGKNVISLASAQGFSYAIWLIPGIIVSNMMATGLMGNAGAMIAWRERGIFNRIAVTPTPLWQVMLARLFSQIAIVVAQAIIAIVASVFLFHFHFDLLSVPLTLIFLVLGTLVFLGLGQVIASLTNRIELGSIISQGIYIVLSFLTGIMIPLQLLPSTIAHIASFTPSYMVVSLLRATMLEGNAGGISWVSLIGLVVYFAASMVISALCFKTIR